MESYEKEWLGKQPLLRLIMFSVGLFDRPADGASLRMLRDEPLVFGIFRHIEDDAWNRGVSRLREAKLLTPATSPHIDTIDAHPLVRDWFSERFMSLNIESWRAAHSRLFEYLRDRTREGKSPTLGSLAPLYQAVSHACKAGRLRDAYQTFLIRIERIERAAQGNKHYATSTLGAYSSDLAIMSKFFATPFSEFLPGLSHKSRVNILSHAAVCLRAQGRFGEALAITRKANELAQAWVDSSAPGLNALMKRASGALSLSRLACVIGDLNAAYADALVAADFAERLTIEPANLWIAYLNGLREKTMKRNLNFV